MKNRIEVTALPECWLCKNSMDMANEVEVVLDEPQYDACVVNGEAKLLKITARYFCSEAHANDYKQWLSNHKREAKV